MFLNYDELMIYFQNLRQNDYQRDNFDHFLKKVKFKYTVPSIHIAGTNGKGTTGSVINNVYINQGYKVGYYRSPYFVYPSETIEINHKGISLDYFNDIINKYQKEIKKYNLSQFEVETFVAFNYFMDNECEIAIIECGMGGETDATNIFTPILSIITSVDLEHCYFLGNSISEIAFNKADIIKEEVPTLVGELPEDALNAIIEVAKDMDSNVFKADDFYNEKIIDKDHYEFDFKPFEKLQINNLAKYVLKDAAISLSALHLLKDRFDISESSIRQGLLDFNLKGRMNVIFKNPLVIVDGAHNPHASHALRESIEQFNTNEKPIHVVFAAFRDKNIDSMLAELSFISKDITLTTFDNLRARKEEEYFLFLDEYTFKEDAIDLINEKINEYPDDIIIITGSLAFAGYIMNNLDKINFTNVNKSNIDIKE